MSYIKATLFLFMLLSCNAAVSTNTQTRIINSFYASAYGDALGRVTEFISSTEGIFNKYPNGVRSFDDFTKGDWEGIPEIYKLLKKAPYTDDTAMALLVAEVLIRSQKKSWSLNKTMSEIAYSFIEDKGSLTYGWAASFRAPGNACMKGVRALERKLSGNLQTNWWDVNAYQAGGCGSVMRAFPFGLVFHNSTEKAKLWAVEHSKLTHGHPIALAACAAMAVGTALCVTTKHPKPLPSNWQTFWDSVGFKERYNLTHILNAMIDAAEEYDAGTAEKMRRAIIYAKEAQVLLKGRAIETALDDPVFRAFHNKVFAEFAGWAAHDAIAATVYVFALYPKDLRSALYVAVNTSGDSDSIAAMSGALVGAYHSPSTTYSWKYRIEDSERIYKLVDKITSNIN